MRLSHVSDFFTFILWLFDFISATFCLDFWTFLCYFFVTFSKGVICHSKQATPDSFSMLFRCRVLSLTGKHFVPFFFLITDSSSYIQQYTKRSSTLYFLFFWVKPYRGIQTDRKCIETSLVIWSRSNRYLWDARQQIDWSPP